MFISHINSGLILNAFLLLQIEGYYHIDNVFMIIRKNFRNSAYKQRKAYDAVHVTDD